jgi:hypothetical protein
MAALAAAAQEGILELGAQGIVVQAAQEQAAPEALAVAAVRAVDLTARQEACMVAVAVAV